MTNELNFNSIDFMETTQAGFDCSNLENPMGDRKKGVLRVNFDSSMKMRAVKVCVKSKDWKKGGVQKPDFRAIFLKNRLEIENS